MPQSAQQGGGSCSPKVFPARWWQLQTEAQFHLPQALVLKVVKLEKRRKQRSPTCEGLLDGNLSVIALLVGQTLFHFKCFLSQEKLPKGLRTPTV